MKAKTEKEKAWERVLELWPDSIYTTKYKALLAAILKWGS